LNKDQMMTSVSVDEKPRASSLGATDRLTRARVTRARALFLVAAFLSFVLSVILYFSGDETEGIFVGLWVPSILALGAFLVPRESR
jgi:hypothetical protein